MMIYKYYKKRLIELDFLRGIAILLVLICHYPVVQSFQHLWIGVDLFFILSGYLVSGILISEYLKSGKIDYKRFFIRRGLKIYPSYYLFVLFTVILISIIRIQHSNYFSVQITPERFFLEVFYLQNFSEGVWRHTWTLAVEEQFYILFPLLLLALIKFKNVISRLMIVMIFLIIAINILRPLECIPIPYEYLGTPLIPFQLRLDALFLGVLVKCIELRFLKRLIQVKSIIWFAGILFCILCIIVFAFVLNLHNCYVSHVGFMFINLSMAFMLLSFLMLRHKNHFVLQKLETNWVVQSTAAIGIYSYNIYLWHAFLVEALFGIVYTISRDNIFNPYAWRYFVPYMVLSIGIGIIVSRLVEIPLLKWRDKKFK